MKGKIQKRKKRIKKASKESIKRRKIIQGNRGNRTETRD